MKVQSTFYPDFISKTVDILLIIPFISKKYPNYWYLMHLRCWFARKMSQFTHFCGAKFLSWKSGCVKFWTNFMSEYDAIGLILFKGKLSTAHFWYYELEPIHSLYTRQRQSRSSGSLGNWIFEVVCQRHLAVISCIVSIIIIIKPRHCLLTLRREE